MSFRMICHTIYHPTPHPHPLVTANDKGLATPLGMTLGSIRIPLWGNGHFGHYERSKRKIIISSFSQVFIS